MEQEEYTPYEVLGSHLAMVLVVVILDKTIGKRKAVFFPHILNPKNCVLKRIF